MNPVDLFASPQPTSNVAASVTIAPSIAVFTDPRRVRTLETAAANRPDPAGPLAPWSGATDLFIYPPYEFKMVDALVTNFHLPRTSLLLLVGAFAGDELLRRAYEAAIAEGYRFYSYGDAMLIL